jgi:MarR family transcriptional regulator, lower aerobic nicotinate degradation pathway regulator
MGSVAKFRDDRGVVAIGPEISRETLEGLSETEQRDLLRLLDRVGQRG